MGAAAPVLNKVVTSPPARAREANAGQVAAAIDFGAALQELVARARLRPDGPPDAPAEPRGSGPRFPEDLSHRRKPRAALRATLGKLRKLEPLVVGVSETEPVSGGEAEDGTQADFGRLAPHPQFHATNPGGSRAGSASAAKAVGENGATPLRGSPAGRVAEKVELLLEAHAEDESLGNLYGHLSAEGGLDDLVSGWDAFVVERLAVTAPRVLAGYRVGKALGRTRWSIRCARQEAGPEGKPVSGAWNAAFGARRIGELQRQINALNDVLDPEALTIVATSLGYWRNSLLSLPEIIAGGGRAGARRGGGPVKQTKTIEIPEGRDDELEDALERQFDGWMDLLTGRRAPESFPVAGIVSSLTKNLVASPWARTLGVVLPVVGGAGILSVLAIVGTTTLGYPLPGGDGEPVAGLLGGIGAVVLAFLGVRGRAAGGGNAPGDLDRLRGQLAALDDKIVGLLDEGAPELAAIAKQVSWQGLKDDVLSQLVAQIRLEELNIAVSKPLADFVLALNDDGSDDPMEDARRFLRLVYGGRSNLERLLPVFTALYKHFRTSPSA